MAADDQLLERATGRHRAGDLAGAGELYRELLAANPDHSTAQFRLGLLALQSGRLDEALAGVRRAVERSPQDVRFRLGLGQVLSALRDWDGAARTYRDVLALDAGSVDAAFALGVALQARGDYAPAIEAYRHALSGDPGLPDAENNLGICQQLQGDLPAAESSYRRALALRPDYAAAMANLGVVLRTTGRGAEALPWLRSAVEQEPLVASHRLNLGAALCEVRQFADAERVLRQLTASEAEPAEVAYNLANALSGLGRSTEAMAEYRRALAANARHWDAWVNLGNACRAAGELEQALAAYQQVIQHGPASIAAVNNAGCVLRSMGRLDDAEAMLRRGLSLPGDHATLLGNLGTVLKDAGGLAEAMECFRESLRLDPSDAATHSNLAYTLSFSELDGSVVRAECERWAARFAQPGDGVIGGHPNDRSPERRLRIGYVSPDFRDHCQSLFTVPLLAAHDRTQVEVVAYSSVGRPDAVTSRLSGLVDAWRDVRLLDDAQLAEAVRSDRIDILVDLTMHMAGSRLRAFAHKPAPVQVAWLAYPGTTGVAAIDYRFTDPHLEDAMTAAHYSERSETLDDSFWCYDPQVAGLTPNSLPALAAGFVTFGCLNNPCKLTATTLRLWAGVLRSVPASRLVLMAPEGRARATVAARLQSLGIDPARLDFVPFQPRTEYLKTYHAIDVGLDTFPYNGHTTSLDAFWMGVPVVTRVGPTCVGRAGLSQLRNLQLEHLAGTTDEQFVARAAALATDLTALAELRATLRTRLAGSPLMDAPRFARTVEATYRRIWREYCAGRS